LVNNPVPPGFSYAFGATLESGSGSIVNGEPGERTLLTLWPGDSDAGLYEKTRAYQGADSWYRDEVYFPSSFQATKNTDFNWFYELHNYPDNYGDVNLAAAVVMDSSDCATCAYNQGRLSVRVIGGGSPENPIDATDSNGQQLYDADDYWVNPDVQQDWIVGPPLQTGQWYDMVWHIHWDWRANNAGGQGFVEYFINGTEVGSYSGPTLFYYANNGGGSGGPGQAYLQDGYYRPDNSDAGYSQPSITVYHAGTMIGPTSASVGEPNLQ
jgi:Polysaccharide lyase